MVMAECRLESQWDLASAVMALTANIHRGRGQKAFSPNDFNPLRKKKKGKVPITVLKDVFVREGKK